MAAVFVYNDFLLFEITFTVEYYYVLLKEYVQ
jgi:hypothetical protein